MRGQPAGQHLVGRCGFAQHGRAHPSDGTAPKTPASAHRCPPPPPHPRSCLQSPQRSAASHLSSSTVHLGSALQPGYGDPRTPCSPEAERRAVITGRAASVLATLPPRDAAELLAAKAFLASF